MLAPVSLHSPPPHLPSHTDLMHIMVACPLVGLLSLSCQNTQVCLACPSGAHSIGVLAILPVKTLPLGFPLVHMLSLHPLKALFDFTSLLHNQSKITYTRCTPGTVSTTHSFHDPLFTPSTTKAKSPTLAAHLQTTDNKIYNLPLY